MDCTFSKGKRLLGVVESSAGSESLVESVVVAGDWLEEGDDGLTEGARE